MTQIIDGRKIKNKILEDIRKEVLQLHFVPIFCDILVGGDLSSLQYVRMKAKVAEDIGIKFRTANFDNQAETKDLVLEIENLNRVPAMAGVIVQLPLPDKINKKIVLDAISPSLDVDCLGFINSENFYQGQGGLSYPTALACLKIIDSLNIDLSELKILILGQGMLVGLPLSHLLRVRGLKVMTVDSKTKNKELLIKESDLIVSAIGKAKFLKGDMIKKGAIVIDAGTSEDNGAIVGDVDIGSMMGIASFVSPTPGGVGPVTVAMLMWNILQVAKNKK